MSKVAIGYLRVIGYLLLGYFLDLPSSDEIKFYISDLYHGSHIPDARNSLSVQITMLVILELASFYVIQTVVYIFIGNALQGYNTSPCNFIKHVIAALRKMNNDKYFWTSDSSNSDYKNIDALLRYRDNKMALMNNDQAAELMKRTSHIDMLRNSSDLPQSKKALSYLNNKIALMDNEGALKYIQNDH